MPAPWQGPVYQVMAPHEDSGKVAHLELQVREMKSLMKRMVRQGQQLQQQPQQQRSSSSQRSRSQRPESMPLREVYALAEDYIMTPEPCESPMDPYGLHGPHHHDAAITIQVSNSLSPAL